MSSTTRRVLSELCELLAEPPSDPLAVLELAAEVRGRIEELEARAVADAQADAATWEEIGRALGVTRSAAYQRFGKRPR